MKIDISSGGYGYSALAYYGSREAEDPEIAEEAPHKNMQSLAASQTPLSPNLASALWTVERSRKNAVHSGESLSNGPNGGILDRYLEFDISSPDEFH